MKQLWEWTATDAFGRSQKYQAHGPDVTEAGMLEHLQKHFRNVTITGLRRCKDGEYKPATGAIEAHTYHFGALDALYRAEGIMPYTDMLARQRQAIARSPILRPSILRTPISRNI